VHKTTSFCELSIAEDTPGVEPIDFVESREPEDLPGHISFAELLNQELRTVSLFRLSRDLGDDIIRVAIGNVTIQCEYVQYPVNEITTVLQAWRMARP
jgi:hypothetical protein